MAKGNSWSDCIVSLEKVAEGSNRSVTLLNSAIEKLSVVMAAIKDARRFETSYQERRAFRIQDEVRAK